MRPGSAYCPGPPEIFVRPFVSPFSSRLQQLAQRHLGQDARRCRRAGLVRRERFDFVVGMRLRTGKDGAGLPTQPHFSQVGRSEEACTWVLLGFIPSAAPAAIGAFFATKVALTLQ